MCDIKPVVKINRSKGFKSGILPRGYEDEIKREKVDKASALVKLECINFKRIWIGLPTKI